MVDDVFQKIVDIIKTDFKCSFPGGRVILQDISGRPVPINKSGKFLCLELDRKNTHIFPFFFDSSIKDLCKISDRVLIYPKQNTLFVFVVELKSGNTTGAIKQVRASYELSRYICRTALRMLNNHYDVDIKYRGLIFSSQQNKGTTKPSNLKYTHDENSELMYQHFQSGYPCNLDILCY